MDENAKGLRGAIPKLPEVRPYEPVPYQVEAMLDPFKSGKIEPESKSRDGRGKGSIYQPDFDARELRNSLLEKYPLESLRLIGYLNVNKRPLAVIQVEDKVKQVRVGEYLGLDFGMVTRITEREVELRELVQDSAGDWSERTSLLNLQNQEGNKK
jgi:type IV pilus assembly protein PilP